MAKIVYGKRVHGYELRHGATYCTDCGQRLEVGSYAEHSHRDPITSGRGECPNEAPHPGAELYNGETPLGVELEAGE